MYKVYVKGMLCKACYWVVSKMKGSKEYTRSEISSEFFEMYGLNSNAAVAYAKYYYNSDVFEHVSVWDLHGELRIIK